MLASSRSAATSVLLSAAGLRGLCSRQAPLSAATGCTGCVIIGCKRSATSAACNAAAAAAGHRRHTLRPAAAVLPPAAGLPRRSSVVPTCTALSRWLPPATPSSAPSAHPQLASRSAFSRRVSAMAAGNQPAGVLQIERVPCLSDNYSWCDCTGGAGVHAGQNVSQSFKCCPAVPDATPSPTHPSAPPLVPPRLLHEPSAGVTAVVDPAEVAPVVAAAERLGWTLTHILNSE